MLVLIMKGIENRISSAVYVTSILKEERIETHVPELTINVKIIK